MSAGVRWLVALLPLTPAFACGTTEDLPGPPAPVGDGIYQVVIRNVSDATVYLPTSGLIEPTPYIALLEDGQPIPVAMSSRKTSTTAFHPSAPPRDART